MIVQPNPRGSPGFGQQFVDEVSQDWGGKAMTDIDAVVNAVAKMPFVDSEHLGIAGASYGGYAVNWIIGHTNRFKVAVSHDGVFNLESISFATEELWFNEWEFGGPPWSPKARANFAKFSPHLFADRILSNGRRSRHRARVKQQLEGVHTRAANRFCSGRLDTARRVKLELEESIRPWLQVVEPNEVTHAAVGSAAGGDEHIPG